MKFEAYDHVKPPHFHVRLVTNVSTIGNRFFCGANFKMDVFALLVPSCCDKSGTSLEQVCPDHVKGLLCHVESTGFSLQSMLTTWSTCCAPYLALSSSINSSFRIFIHLEIRSIFVNCLLRVATTTVTKDNNKPSILFRVSMSCDVKGRAMRHVNDEGVG